MIKIVIDKREKDERRKKIKDVMDYLEGSVVTEDTLSICDYLVYKDDGILFGVEWKTYNDYVSSIMNGHLKSQLNDMEECKFPTYLIVTKYDYRQWRISHADIHVTKEQIDGFTTSVAGRYKTKMVAFDSESNGVDGLLKLITIHMGHNPITDIQLPERKKRTGNPSMDMYLSVPGLGPKKSKDLCDRISFYELLRMVKESETRRDIRRDGISIPPNSYEFMKSL